jgi:hypothetical protein
MILQYEEISRSKKDSNKCNEQKDDIFNVTKAVVRKSILMQIKKPKRKMDPIRQRHWVAASMSIIASHSNTASGLIKMQQKVSLYLFLFGHSPFDLLLDGHIYVYYRGKIILQIEEYILHTQ